LGDVAVARFREKLAGGTRTSIGDADQVIAKLLKAPAGLTDIYKLFLDEDPVVAMRASYVAMRVAEQKPESVKPFAKDLLKNLELYTQQEVRWHIPQLLVHLDLTKAQKKRAYEVIMNWAETDKSKIVGYYGFQAAANFAETDEQLLEDFIPRIRKANKTGAKSIQNRCKKIAKQLDIAL
jgi:outer membrane PBP1 activator LpoA protein